MRILITGAHGFLATSLAHRAVAAGHVVAGLGRNGQAPLPWPGTYQWADVSRSDLVPFFADFQPEVVAHCAGPASVARSFQSPLDDFYASVLTLANVLDGVRRYGRRVVIAVPSSAAVYGNPESQPVNEDARVAPISPYGCHKVQAEMIARSYARHFGLEIVIGRIFSLVGPAQRRLLLWDLFQEARSTADALRIQGTGEETRDFLHVDDASDALLGLANMALDRILPTEAVEYNVASGCATSVAEVAELVRAEVSPKLRIERRNQIRKGDPARWCADIGRLKAALPDWRPRSAATAMRECLVRWRKS